MKKGNVVLTGIALTGGTLLLAGVFRLTAGKKSPPAQVLKFVGLDEYTTDGPNVLATLENHGEVKTSTFDGATLVVTWQPERAEWVDVAKTYYPDKLVMQTAV